MNCDLAGFTIQDIILLIGMEGRTGELVIESGNNIGSMHFHEGRILLAFSPYSRAIGDLLVEGGMITDDELLEALKLQKKSNGMLLGTLLVKAGKVQRNVIEVMVREQIRRAVREFLAWPEARVSFNRKDIHPVDLISMPVHEFLPADMVKHSQLFFAELHL